MNEPRCVIFDFGNVLAFFDHKRACRQLASLSANRFSEDQIDKIYVEIFERGLEKQYDNGEISTSEFRSELRKLFKLSSSISDDQLDLAWSDIFSRNQPIVDLIVRLRAMSYRLLIASNTNELHHHFFSREFRDILQHFDGIVLSFSENVKCRKPDPKFYDECKKIAGTRASKCVFVDDIHTNVQGAISCGMKGILYTSTDELAIKLAEVGIPIR